MSRNRSFERRAQEEVERIKAQEAAEAERKQARLRELSEQARERRETEAAEERRRNQERNAKLRQAREEKAEVEERLAKDSARLSWTANGGTEAAFDQAWPAMWDIAPPTATLSSRCILSLAFPSFATDGYLHLPPVGPWRAS